MSYDELQTTIWDLGRRMLETEDGTPAELARIAEEVAETEAGIRTHEPRL